MVKNPIATQQENWVVVEVCDLKFEENVVNKSNSEQISVLGGKEKKVVGEVGRVELRVGRKKRNVRLLYSQLKTWVGGKV